MQKKEGKKGLMYAHVDCLGLWTKRPFTINKKEKEIRGVSCPLRNKTLHPKKTYQLASCQATATTYSQGQPFVLPKHTEEKHSAHATIRQVSWVVH